MNRPRHDWQITDLFHQLKESLYAVSRTTECLSHETRRRTNRQHHCFTIKYHCDLHMSFTWEEDMCFLRQLWLDWPASPHAADAGTAKAQRSQFDSAARTRDQWRVTEPRQPLYWTFISCIDIDLCIVIDMSFCNVLFTHSLSRTWYFTVSVMLVNNSTFTYFSTQWFHI